MQRTIWTCSRRQLTRGCISILDAVFTSTLNHRIHLSGLSRRGHVHTIWFSQGSSFSSSNRPVTTWLNRMATRSLFWSVAIVTTSILVMGSCRGPTDPSPAATLKDVFPLSENLQVTYGYYSDIVKRDGGPIFESSDSGLVVCRVVRSTRPAGTTSIQWTVEESLHLLHSEYRFSPNRTLVFSEWKDIARILLLYEDLGDLHSITCDGLVWTFPIRDTLGTWTSALPCSRFAFEAPEMLVAYHSYSAGVLELSDTVRFDEAIGLISRRCHAYGWAMTATQQTLTIQMIPAGAIAQPRARRLSRPMGNNRLRTEG
jgi:hypothetical protein